MNLTRWNANPTRDLLSLQDQVDRLFDGVFAGTPRSQSRGNAALFVPPVDIEESEDAFLIRADLPGIPQKDVKVTLTGDTLTLRGERRHEVKHGLHRSERVHGSFERSFTLGAPVQADRIEAMYRDGVLEIRVPKAEEAKVKEIPIRVGS